MPIVDISDYHLNIARLWGGFGPVFILMKGDMRDENGRFRGETIVECYGAIDPREYFLPIPDYPTYYSLRSDWAQYARETLIPYLSLEDSPFTAEWANNRRWDIWGVEYF